MATFTNRLNLRKPATSDFVNVTTDISDNMDAIDNSVLWARKTSDESVTSSTTLQNDDHLFLSVAANCTYHVEALILYSARSDTDFKYKWDCPAGSALKVTSYGLAVGDTTTDGTTIYYGHVNESSTGVHGGAAAENTTFMTVNMTGVLVVSSTAGTMRFTWAQNTSNATAAIVRSHSYLKLTKVEDNN